MHFGLGEHAVLDRLSVRFADGRTWSKENVTVDRHLRIRAEQDEPEDVSSEMDRVDAREPAEDRR